MERFICIHGHFYQPPRENPWLEEIEMQDSAYPYHDWNERITAECYAPNSASRLLDGEGRIGDMANNYARMSFNFGPTLLLWMEAYSPAIYRAILDADRQSSQQHSGHGNALAQVYNHVIMPLANARDKRTQILWGIKDFEYRFKRFPEGMWLPETAVDMTTLDMLAEYGIKFTILSSHQASKVRKIGTGKWKEVGGGLIDPTRAYLCKLPSNRRITIFFYDGPLSRAVAFEGVLNKGEDFASRILTGFSDARDWPQLINIATDGESYGHHHRFGDMALAYALHHIESNNLASLTNYGEYLERYPPLHEVQIYDNTSWSCAHGIERWRGNCGCNSGGHSGWNQEWRAPLREAFDWLRDRLSALFEEKAKKYLKDPWSARDDYIGVVVDRTTERVERFLKDHALKDLHRNERTAVLELMEIQRNAMLMYTSCGWFFDELSGIETVQLMQYAGRAIQLGEKISGTSLEGHFREILSKAQSNLPEYGDGSRIYENFVKPAVVDLGKVAAHYAISSLIRDYSDTAKIFCYSVKREDYRGIQAGETKLAVGRITVTSDITLDSETVSFSTLHPGGYVFNGGSKTNQGDAAYQVMKQEMLTYFEKGEISQIVRIMDKHFGMNNYSLVHLFRDEQRKILNLVITKTIEEFERAYRLLYENNRTLMVFLQKAGMPIPKALLTAAEFTLIIDLKKAFLEERVNEEKIRDIISAIGRWGLHLDGAGLEFMLRRRGEELIDAFRAALSNPLLSDVLTLIGLLRFVPLEVDFRQIQNTYFMLAKTTYREFALKAKAGDDAAMEWTEAFRRVGEMLFFNMSSILQEERPG
jgi:alpha-amylase/alpha-mannosidase (GH57 family)